MEYIDVDPDGQNHANLCQQHCLNENLNLRRRKLYNFMIFSLATELQTFSRFFYLMCTTIKGSVSRDLR